MTSAFQKLGALLLTLFLFPLGAAAQSFTDLSPSYKHWMAISALSDVNIVGGYPDGSFEPENPISRAEAAKILIGATKPPHLIEEAQDNPLYPFSDVGPGEWFSPYVFLAYQNGIAQGYPDGSFAPGKTLGMAEGLKMILEAYGVDVSGVYFAENPLLLVNPEDWFAPYFGYASSHNLINRQKFYHPAQAMTRGEFAETLYRLKTIRESGEENYPEMAEAPSDEYTITIPRLNIIDLKVSFADPFDAQGALTVLNDGLGHYLSAPGEGHKMVLFGHSSGYDWDHSPYKTILTKIDHLQEGDRIYLNYHEKGYVYQVARKEIRPAGDMGAVMEDYGSEELNLYTCWPPKSISKRYVVYAYPL